MRKSTIRYIYRVMAVAAFILSFILIDSFLQGALSFWGLLFLLPASALSARYAYKLSQAKPAKRKVKAIVLNSKVPAKINASYSVQRYMPPAFNKAS